MHAQPRTLRVTLALLAGLSSTAISTTVAAQSATTELVASGFDHPLELAFSQDGLRTFVVEQSGRVRLRAGGQTLATPYLDVSSDILFGTWTGLRGFVLHPDHASNGHAYIWYDELPSGAAEPDIVIERWTASTANPDVADPATRIELLRIPQERQAHGGGAMRFGPDGFLYGAMGDGWGLGGDPSCNAQNGQLLLGKIFRIDVDSASPYAIPPDNPFVGVAGVRDEVWHLGLRHPWRFSFDRVTGDMYIADVGQSGLEELDFAPAGLGGLNFGWKAMEGTLCNSVAACAGVAPCNDPGYELPFHTYPIGGGNCSITGGFVYRGSALPALQGHYLFGDWCSGRIWSLRLVGGSVLDLSERTAELGGPFPQLTTFGEDASGELYIARGSGEVHRIVPTCAATNYCAGLPNSSGPGAAISVSGSTSIAANTFTLLAAGATPGQFGLFFYGPSPISSPFGDGLRCVGGATSRLNPPQPADAFGDAARPVDFSSPPASAGVGAITSGSTWNFQLWYRDPGGPGGTGFNLSDAVSVEFCP